LTEPSFFPFFLSLLSLSFSCLLFLLDFFKKIIFYLGPLQLDNANRLWIEKSFPLHEEFLKKTAEYYHASAEPTNFRGDAEGERVRINRWIEEQTRNKIKDLIPSGSVNAQTPLVLTNAIYFKANWVHMFKKEKSHDGVRLS